MSSDIVRGEGRGLGLGIADLTVRDEAGFDEGLEAVANAENETVTFRDEFHHRVADDGVTQDGGDEFAGAIGFVTGAEAAWDEQDL